MVGTARSYESNHASLILQLTRIDRATKRVYHSRQWVQALVMPVHSHGNGRLSTDGVSLIRPHYTRRWGGRRDTHDKTRPPGATAGVHSGPHARRRRYHMCIYVYIYAPLREMTVAIWKLPSLSLYVGVCGYHIITTEPGSAWGNSGLAKCLRMIPGMWVQTAMRAHYAGNLRGTLANSELSKMLRNIVWGGHFGKLGTDITWGVRG